MGANLGLDAMPVVLHGCVLLNLAGDIILCEVLVRPILQLRGHLRDCAGGGNLNHGEYYISLEHSAHVYSTGTGQLQVRKTYCMFYVAELTRTVSNL